MSLRATVSCASICRPMGATTSSGNSGGGGSASILSFAEVSTSVAGQGRRRRPRSRPGREPRRRGPAPGRRADRLMLTAPWRPRSWRAADDHAADVCRCPRCAMTAARRRRRTRETRAASLRARTTRDLLGLAPGRPWSRPAPSPLPTRGRGRVGTRRPSRESPGAPGSVSASVTRWYSTSAVGRSDPTSIPMRRPARTPPTNPASPLSVRDGPGR